MDMTSKVAAIGATEVVHLAQVVIMLLFLLDTEAHLVVLLLVVLEHLTEVIMFEMTDQSALVHTMDHWPDLLSIPARKADMIVETTLEGIMAYLVIQGIQEIQEIQERIEQPLARIHLATLLLPRHLPSLPLLLLLKLFLLPVILQKPELRHLGNQVVLPLQVDHPTRARRHLLIIPPRRPLFTIVRDL